MAELDRKRLFNTWSGIPGCVGFDRDHRPMRAPTKTEAAGDIRANMQPQPRPLLASAKTEVHLQDGKFFDSGGEELDETRIPAEIRAWRASHPRTPGVTEEPAVIYECPLPGCELRFTWRSIFEEHLQAHALPQQALDEYMRQVSGGATKLSVPWSESDFGGAVPHPEPAAVAVAEGLEGEE